MLFVTAAPPAYRLMAMDAHATGSEMGLLLYEAFTGQVCANWLLPTMDAGRVVTHPNDDQPKIMTACPPKPAIHH